MVKSNRSFYSILAILGLLFIGGLTYVIVLAYKRSKTTGTKVVETTNASLIAGWAALTGQSVSTTPAAMPSPPKTTLPKKTSIPTEGIASGPNQNMSLYPPEVPLNASYDPSDYYQASGIP